MLLLHEYPPPRGNTLVPTREPPEIREAPTEAGDETTPPSRRPRSGWLVVSAVAALAVAGAFWWLIDARVPQGDYDDVVTQLDDRGADLTALESEYAELQRELSRVTAELTADRDELTTRLAERDVDIDRLNRQFDSMSASNDRLRASTELESGRAEALLADKELLMSGASDLADVVRARAYIMVNLSPAYLAEYVEAGGDVSAFDAMLVALGEDVTIQEWIDGRNAWAVANRAVFAVGDDPLIVVWDRWSRSEPGSDAEWVAWLDLEAHLDALITDRTVALAATE